MGQCDSDGAEGRPICRIKHLDGCWAVGRSGLPSLRSRQLQRLRIEVPSAGHSGHGGHSQARRFESKAARVVALMGHSEPHLLYNNPGSGNQLAAD